MNTPKTDGPGTGRANIIKLNPPPPNGPRANAPAELTIRIPEEFSSSVGASDGGTYSYETLTANRQVRRWAMLEARDQLQVLVRDYGRFAEFIVMLDDAAKKLAWPFSKTEMEIGHMSSAERAQHKSDMAALKAAKIDLGRSS